MKTYMAKPQEVKRKWYVVDAEGKPLGRLASEIAKILRGKNKTVFTPHVDCGDFVILINAEKIGVTGKKMEQKMYYRHSGYIGNLKVTNLGKLMKSSPDYVIRKAVKGMLPHNTLGKKLLRKLKVYSGSNHPHKAQKPEVLEI